MRAPNDRGLDAANDQTPKQTTDVIDSTAAALRKRESTLIASAALRGIVIVRTEDDYGRAIYIASRYALTRRLDNLDDAEAWLARVTGEAP